MRPGDGFQRATFGLTTGQAVEQRICVTCPKRADAFCCEKANREYGISGMCQFCQDSVFGAHDHRKTGENGKPPFSTAATPVACTVVLMAACIYLQYRRIRACL